MTEDAQGMGVCQSDASIEKRFEDLEARIQMLEAKLRRNEWNR